MRALNPQHTQGTIIDTLNSAGLQQDCPFVDGSNGVQELTAENVSAVDEEKFNNYALQIASYLQVGKPLHHLLCTQHRPFQVEP